MKPTPEDLSWIESSIDSGIKYGYPECCIKEFVQYPPSVMKKMTPTEGVKLRLYMAHINGQYTGFIPCLKHAQMIRDGHLNLHGLINGSARQDPSPFPEGGEFV